jgi:hypothetical protein
MNQNKIAFLVPIIALSVFIILISETLFFFTKIIRVPFYYQGMIFFALFSYITILFLKKVKSQNPKQFPKFFLNSSILKIVFSVLFITFYWFTMKEFFLVFVAGFFIHYFLYTLLSVIIIAKQL